MTRTQKAVATNRKRNNSQEHKDAVALMAQLKAYSKAHAEARKNGTPLPFLKDFTGQ